MSAALGDSPELLSEREREVLRLMAAGASNSAIAERLITPRGVEAELLARYGA